VAAAISLTRNTGTAHVGDWQHIDLYKQNALKTDKEPFDD